MKFQVLLAAIIVINALKQARAQFTFGNPHTTKFEDLPMQERHQILREKIE